MLAHIIFILCWKSEIGSKKSLHLLHITLLKHLIPEKICCNMLLLGRCSPVGWLVVFNVPSTARSFRDGTPIYCPLRRTWSSINTPFRPGIEPRAVAWQSITLPLRYASSTVFPGIPRALNIQYSIGTSSVLLWHTEDVPIDSKFISSLQLF